jgi:hypothetical protein
MVIWKYALQLTQESPRAFHIASQIAPRQGNEVQARKYISRAYRLTDAPVDISPFLARGKLSQEIVQSFLVWANGLERAGETAQTQEVIEWLEKQQP